MRTAVRTEPTPAPEDAAGDAAAAGEPAAIPPASTAPAAAATSASAPSAAAGAADDAAAQSAARIWRDLRALVLERNERRKETVEAIGMSFFRVKVLRRVATSPARLSELAGELGSDRPYLTLVVDDLEKRGLVERRLHPTDRRCKIVSATPEGKETAARAESVLGTPPPALLALAPADLAVLERIAAQLASDPHQP